VRRPLKRIALWCIPTLLLILAWQLWDRVEAARFQRAIEALAVGDTLARSASTDDRGWRLYKAADILVESSAEQFPLLGSLRDALAEDRPVDPSLVRTAASFVARSSEGIALAAQAVNRPPVTWTVGGRGRLTHDDPTGSRRVENAYALVMLHAQASGDYDAAALAAVNRARLLRVYDRERYLWSVVLKAAAAETLGRDIGSLLGRPLPRERLDELDAALDGVFDRAEIADAVRRDALQQRTMFGVPPRAAAGIPPLVHFNRPLVLRRAAETQRSAFKCIAMLDRPWPDLLAAVPQQPPSSASTPSAPVEICGRTARAVARALAVSRSVRLAVRLERQRLASGELPEQLPEPQPAEEFSDPFSGQPMRYKRTADGYTIYSLGTDGTDDGGNVTELGSRSLPIWGRAIAGKDFGVGVHLRTGSSK